MKITESRLRKVIRQIIKENFYEESTFGEEDINSIKRLIGVISDCSHQIGYVIDGMTEKYNKRDAALVASNNAEEVRQKLVNAMGYEISPFKNKNRFKMSIFNNISKTFSRGLLVKYRFFEDLDFDVEEVRQACQELENVECDELGVVIDTENFESNYFDEDPKELDFDY